MNFPKQYFLSTVALLIAVVAMAGDTPFISFDRVLHDFGKISTKGGVVSTEFQFTNKGDAPLIIISSHTTCTCSKISFSKKPIAKDQSGTIKVQFDPKRQLGTFMKTIQIFSNSSTKKDIVTIKGEVYEP